MRSYDSYVIDENPYKKTASLLHFKGHQLVIFFLCRLLCAFVPDRMNTTNLLSRNCPSEYFLQRHHLGAYTLIFINIYCSVLGVMSNFLVCAVILTTQVMNQRSFHYFVTSLVAADLLTSVVAQPLLVLVLADHMSFKCTLTIHYAFRSVANIASSSALLKVTFIALDRCLKVQNGFDYTDTFTLRKKIVLAFTWLHSFMFSLVRVWMDKAELTSYFIAVLFGICIACVIVCYTIIYYKVSRYLAFFNTSQPKIMPDGNSRAGAQKNDSPTEDRAQQRLLIFTLVLVQSVTTVGWLPIVYLNLTQPRKYYGLVYYVSATIVLSVSALNPFIYCLNNKEYRRTLMRIFARFFLYFQEMYRKKWKGSFYTTSSVNDTMTTGFMILTLCSRPRIFTKHISYLCIIHGF